MDRPECNPKPPDITQRRDIILYLLEVELERLGIARKIEKERNIVFPETSIIIHDIEKLQEQLKYLKVC